MLVKLESQSDFFTVSRERHAAKRFDDTYRIHPDIIRALIHSASEAASAWNLQHWKFIVVTDRARKEEWFDIAYGQRQIAEASVVVAILGDLQANRNAEESIRVNERRSRANAERLCALR